MTEDYSHPPDSISPELQGAMDACDNCRDHGKAICRTLLALKEIGIHYQGQCGRDTETGIMKKA